MSGELVKFPEGTRGIALNLESKNVGIVLMGKITVSGVDPTRHGTNMVPLISHARTTPLLINVSVVLSKCTPPL
jgi:hypothetical protein